MPMAPDATSLAATLVTTSTATLNATVSPENAATTYHFEYGTDPNSHTDRTPDLEAGVGSDASSHPRPLR